MSRLLALLRALPTHRPLVGLALLVGGLLAVGLGGGAPECWPNGGSC